MSKRKRMQEEISAGEEDYNETPPAPINPVEEETISRAMISRIAKRVKQKRSSR